MGPLPALLAPGWPHLFLGFSWPKLPFPPCSPPPRSAGRHHQDGQSPAIIKSNPYFTDGETEAWEEQTLNPDSLLFWNFVTTNFGAHVGLFGTFGLSNPARVGGSHRFTSCTRAKLAGSDACRTGLRSCICCLPSTSRSLSFQWHLPHHRRTCLTYF